MIMVDGQEYKEVIEHSQFSQVSVDWGKYDR